jgi:hypothetical protein
VNRYLHLLIEQGVRKAVSSNDPFAPRNNLDELCGGWTAAQLRAFTEATAIFSAFEAEAEA